MNDAPVRRPCIFCGSTENKLTNQHVFAEQLRERFEDVIGEEGVTSIRTGSEPPREFPSAPFADKIGGFCNKCNEGWMEDIENQAISILDTMMTGGFPRTLKPSDQLSLSTFAVLSALVLDHQVPKNRVVPDAEYDAFDSKQTPLDHHIVWIGKTDPRVDNLVVAMRKGRVRSIQADTHPDLVRILQEAMSNGQWIYAFTFSIGFVVFQVMGHDIPAALNVNVGPDHFRVLDRIWPVQGDNSVALQGLRYNSGPPR